LPQTEAAGSLPGSVRSRLRHDIRAACTATAVWAAEAPERGDTVTRLLSRVVRPIRSLTARVWDEISLSAEARAARRADHRDGLGHDRGPARAVADGLAWIGRAQDRSATRDGGVARHYSLLSGWGASYPETTGYIIPTLLDGAEDEGGTDQVSRARAMLDWLVSIQLPEGGFQGGTIDQVPVVPVTFNTGQILLGLAAGAARFGQPYTDAMRAAAEWLVRTQDADGAWRRFPSPFAEPGQKTYDTHVAWGLMEAARVDNNGVYLDAALANVRWALRSQAPNGWIADCCLGDPMRPLTHTLGYALRGIIEGARISGNRDLFEAAECTAQGLLEAQRPDGALPGRLDGDFRAAVPWSCLTGNVQIAACWFLLHRETGNERYRTAARRSNAFVRRTMARDEGTEMQGGVRGSFPVDGTYGRFEYLNWACKFMIDANRLEAADERGVDRSGGDEG